MTNKGFFLFIAPSYISDKQLLTRPLHQNYNNNGQKTQFLTIIIYRD